MISVHMTTARRYRSGLLEAAVDSVLSQSYPDLELIICDDASHDGTAGYLGEVAARTLRARVHPQRAQRQQRRDLARTLPAGLRHVPTPGHVDVRRLPAPSGVFADLVARAERDPGLDMVFGTTVVHKHRGTPLLVGHLSQEQIWSEIDRNATLVPNAGILVRRELFDDVGWFDSNVLLRRSCDWEWFRRGSGAGRATSRPGRSPATSSASSSPIPCATRTPPTSGS